MNVIDKRRLQRLVDGELSFEETQLWVRELEQQAQNSKVDDESQSPWRLIAGAFIENQLFRSQFLEHDAAVGSIGQNSPVGRANARPVIVVSSMMRWGAMAASLLLALSVGLVLVAGLDDEAGLVLPTGHGVAMTGTSPTDSDDSSVMAQQQVVSTGHRSSEDNLNQTPAVYRMMVEDPAGHQFLDSDVPLYSSNHDDAAKWLRTVDLPQSFQREAANSGYRVNQNVRYLSGKFSDGRAFVIPVRKFSFHSEQ